MARRLRGGPRRQRGIALFIGLLFLIVLSLVAVVAMRGTLVEMHMVNNMAAQQRAFQISETLRSVPVQLFDQHVFNRGWPKELGGSLSNNDFTYSLPSSMLSAVKGGLQQNCSSQLDDFYGGLEPACNSMPAENRYDPSTWHPDVILKVCTVSSSTCVADNVATIYIVPDGTVLSEGAGSAQAAGYRGVGSGAATGGGSLYFEIMSVGEAPGEGRAVTMAQYRQAIRN